MQKEGTKQTIDNVEYIVYMLAPRVARNMLLQIGKVLGPVIGNVADLKSLDKNVDIGSLLADIAERLDPEVLDDQMNKLAAVTHADGVELSKIFDIHFQGEIGRMFKWYVFALKANFGNFTSALEGVSSSLPSQIKAKE